jgi:hypothetical protein
MKAATGASDLVRSVDTAATTSRDLNVRNGAEGGTRTPTGCPTRPSNVRVCQFRHFGTADDDHARWTDQRARVTSRRTKREYTAIVVA